MAVKATPKQLEAHIRKFNDEVFNGRNYDLIDEMVAEDIVQHGGPGADEMRGRQAFREYLEMTHAGFSDLKGHIDALFVADDKVVARYTYSGTHDGEYLGIPPTDRSVSVEGIVISRIEDGMTAETWIQVDSLGILQQVGLVPEPGELAK